MLIAPFLMFAVVAVILKIDEDKTGEYNITALYTSLVAIWGTYLASAIVSMIGDMTGWWA